MLTPQKQLQIATQSLVAQDLPMNSLCVAQKDITAPSADAYWHKIGTVVEKAFLSTAYQKYCIQVMKERNTPADFERYAQLMTKRKQFPFAPNKDAKLDARSWVRTVRETFDKTGGQDDVLANNPFLAKYLKLLLGVTSSQDWYRQYRATFGLPEYICDIIANITKLMEALNEARQSEDFDNLAVRKGSEKLAQWIISLPHTNFPNRNEVLALIRNANTLILKNLNPNKLSLDVKKDNYLFASIYLEVTISRLS